MAVAIDNKWEEEFYNSINDYLEGDGNRFRVESLWSRYKLDSVEDPRLADISTNIRQLMDQDYRNAKDSEKEAILYEVKELLEQYYSEDQLNKY